ncbi:MAG: hypothetical protein RBS39_02210 [Phycisphaerales bacterium]|jgi:hypothetical protein|nr:hypothetical protein [Phycisphaerales bacterium]
MSRNEAFKQVKAILSKLDRSIDEARKKRTGVDDEPAAPDRAQAQPPRAPEPAPTPARPPSPFGRAKPLDPNRRMQAPGSTAGQSDRS